MPEPIKMEDLAKKLMDSDGREFVVKFVKKDGSERVLRGMLKPVEREEGEEAKKPSWNPIEKGLLPTWDLDKDAYRMVSLKRLMGATVDGVEYEVEPE